MLEQRADLVLGSRTKDALSLKAMLPHQRSGNRLVAFLLRLLYGLEVTDLGPFRAIPKETLLALAMTEMTYGWPIEMMVKAAQTGLRVVEVPVTYRTRLGGRSKVSGDLRGTILAGYHILRTVLKHAKSPGVVGKSNWSSGDPNVRAT